MNISGVLVQTLPARTDAVAAALAAMNGVEVHAQNVAGKIVVTVEQPDAEAALNTVSSFHDIDGILSASLVYEHTEPHQLLESTDPEVSP